MDAQGLLHGSTRGERGPVTGQSLCPVQRCCKVVLSVGKIKTQPSMAVALLTVHLQEYRLTIRYLCLPKQRHVARKAVSVTMVVQMVVHTAVKMVVHLVVQMVVQMFSWKCKLLT